MLQRAREGTPVYTIIRELSQKNNEQLSKAITGDYTRSLLPIVGEYTLDERAVDTARNRIRFITKCYE